MKTLIALLVLLTVVTHFSGCVHRVEYNLSKDELLNHRPRNFQNVDIALVLGGGGAKAYAHLGVLEVLEKNNIPIGLIVGTSAGSIVGALYADDPNIKSVRKKCNTIHHREFLDTYFASAIYGPVRGGYLQDFLTESLRHKNIEDFKIPFAAVATSLESNKSFVFTSGPAIPAVHSSSALPMLFTPVYAYNQHLIDGGTTEPVPVKSARSFNPKMVIAVNISTPPKNTEDYGQLSILGGYNALSIAYHAFTISCYELAKVQVQQADVAISPDLHEFGFLDGTDKDTMYLRGKEAAERALMDILVKMYKLGISKSNRG